MQEASDSQLKSKEHPDLYHKSVKGGYWVTFLQFAMNFLSFVKVIVIANFFFLEDLGIISVALMLMDILLTFTETGFDSALVQKKENIHSYLDTAWTAGLIKGFILFIVLFFAAPIMASIRVPSDKVPLAIAVLRVMSVCFIINAAKNIGTIFFQKELEFRKVFILNLIYSLVDISLSLIFIFIFRSIWGVIAGRLAASLAVCLGSYFLSSYRPRLYFEPSKARELWTYGKWIYGINIVGYLTGQGDGYFVWSCMGVQWLALYRYAFDFATMPAKHISMAISSVSFPAYSKIQSDIPRLCGAYLKVLKVTALLAVPASFLIFMLGPDFVRLFLPERMYPMILALQILAVKGLMGSFNSTTDPVYRSVGKPQLSWGLSMCFLPIMAILIYPLTIMWGIAGTAVATIIPGLCITPVNILMLRRVLHCSITTIFRPFLIPVLTSAVMAGILFLFKRVILVFSDYISFLLPLDASMLEGYSPLFLKMLIFIRPDALSFVCYGIMALSVYGLLVWILDGVFKHQIRELMVEQFQKIKQKLYCIS